MVETLLKINTENFSVTVTDINPSPYKVNTDKKIAIKDVEDDIDEIPETDFAKAIVELFYEIKNGKDGSLPLSNILT